MNDLMNLLKERRTYRRFCQKPISEEILAEILTAARYASSAANKQPLSYVVVKTPQKVQEVFAETKWAAYLPKEQGQPKAGEEPVLFIGVVQNLNGVGSCIIGACNRQKLSELFGLTEDQKLHTVVAFGYPSHISRIENVEKDGDIRYHLDEDGNYVVPKRNLEDVVTCI